jgi:hypothetical protein
LGSNARYIHLFVLDEAAGDVFGVAEINLGDGGTRGAEGDAAELQPRRCSVGARLNEVERKSPGLLVAGLLQHLQAVDDRAGRAD